MTTPTNHAPSLGRCLHRSMKRLLTFVAVALLVFRAAQAQSTDSVEANDVVRLNITVMNVVPLRSFSGTLTPTGHGDPRFALTVRIDSCLPVVTNLNSGTVVTFGVHSPSLFLGGSAEKGSTNVITMPRTKAEGLFPQPSEAAAQVQRWVAVGTSAADARRIMEQRGFTCSLITNGTFGSLRGVDYVYCDRRTGGIIQQRWQAALVLIKGKVSTVHVATGVVGP